MHNPSGLKFWISTFSRLFYIISIQTMYNNEKTSYLEALHKVELAISDIDTPALYIYIYIFMNTREWYTDVKNKLETAYTALNHFDSIKMSLPRQDPRDAS